MIVFILQWKKFKVKNVQGIEIGNEGARCSLLVDDTILPFKNLRKSTDKLLTLIKLARCPNVVYLGKKLMKFINSKKIEYTTAYSY